MAGSKTGKEGKERRRRQRQRQVHDAMQCCAWKDRTKGQPKISAVKISGTNQQEIVWSIQQWRYQ